ncbi:hypothetical protein [Dictyobacter alpinus]|uniref:hypothetical protein n=1 Tax=Dictyobacter alpinus TaxID=2014873 RepID=UPI000F836687|nr:hypothetical protein [Dictyobacter alpinus]
MTTVSATVYRSNRAMIFVSAIAGITASIVIPLPASNGGSMYATGQSNESAPFAARRRETFD